MRFPYSDLEITYVPSHLYHILFELLKNSMRAVMESHGEDAGTTNYIVRLFIIACAARTLSLGRLTSPFIRWSVSVHFDYSRVRLEFPNRGRL